jgi:integrase
VTPDLDRDRAALAADLRASKAVATQDAYAHDGRAFTRWCRARGFDPLTATAETVALHLSSCAAAGHAYGSLVRRVAGIAYCLQREGIPGAVLPTRGRLVREALAGIRRRHVRPSARKQAATTDIMRLLLDTCGDDLQGLRDRALLAIGFAAALRRSELVALDIEDLAPAAQGLCITVRRTGCVLPVGHGEHIRPVAALDDWIAAAGISTGAIFLGVHPTDRVLPRRLTAGMVAWIIKQRARMAGFDPRGFSGQSLRLGFITSAAAHGASVLKIMDVTRHRSLRSLHGSVRPRALFDGYAGDGIL